jgi:hypothetical protein
VTAAKVKVYFLDRSGDVITTLVDWICPRGSQTFFLPVVHDLPGNWVGSVRVESQEWITPGGPLVTGRRTSWRWRRWRSGPTRSGRRRGGDRVQPAAGAQDLRLAAGRGKGGTWTAAWG